MRSIVNRSNDVFEKTTQLRGDAKSNTDVAQAKQKKRYDLKHRPSTFAVGDRVIRYNRRRDTIGKEAS